MPHDERSTATFGTALALVSLSTLLAMLAYSGPLGNAVTLTRVFDATPRGTTWILSSMSAALAVTLLVVGILADRVGRRRIFAIGGAALALGSVISTIATSTVVFVAGRCLQGLGTSALIATGLGLVSHVSIDARHRAAAAAWWAGAMGLGIGLGPVMTGLLDEVDGWRWFYAVLAVSSAGLALAAPRMLPYVPGSPGPRPSLVGFTLLSVGLALLLLGLVETRGGSRPFAIALLAVAAMVLVAFALAQSRPGTALIEPTLLRHRPFIGATTAGFATGLGVIGQMSFVATFLTVATGLSTLQSALVLLLWSWTSAVTGLAVRGRLSAVSGRLQLAMGLAGCGVGVLLMTGVSTSSTWWRLAPGLFIAGMASGVLNAGLARQSVASVPAHRAALGSSANNSARYLGAAIGITAVSLFAGRTTEAAMVHGWNLAALLTGTASLLFAILVLLIDRHHDDSGT